MCDLHDQHEHESTTASGQALSRRPIMQLLGAAGVTTTAMTAVTFTFLGVAGRAGTPLGTKMHTWSTASCAAAAPGQAAVIAAAQYLAAAAVDNALRRLEHCLACLDPLEAPYGTKFELIAMLNGGVTTYVGNELATAERSRSLPWSEEQENAVRIAYLGSQMATGAYPRMAAAFMQDAGPIDLEAVFERALGRVLDAFEPKG
ncbi:TetR/AcrR family transcriptional regulator C-terminal domain-containing protein [Streptomyces sp. NBC_00996]|uniref:TetR/AcrR family transcriptional regulator C-terminal domain-containing protein n=1 Tax=Streptomyces sp. NBC_00996 TaxID=2903710 RepID=UPI00386A4374|nr:TetR/AcrR family transcriptional regulator C-terminal domain-containing protein [Streptomyces sp. NBC_00996]